MEQAVRQGILVKPAPIFPNERGGPFHWALQQRSNGVKAMKDISFEDILAPWIFDMPIRKRAS